MSWRSIPVVSRPLVFALWAGVLLSVSGCRGTPLKASEALGSVQPVAFGEVLVGETATAALLVSSLSSTGFALVDAGSFDGGFGGADPGDFGLVALPPAQVPPGGQAVSGTLSFTPTAAGTRSGVFTLATNIKNSPRLNAALTGVGLDPAGLQIQASPSPLAFHAVSLGDEKSLALTVTNLSTFPAPLQPPSIGGAAAATYTAVLDGGAAGAPVSIPGQGTVTLTVTFHPTALGQAPATLELKACRICAPLAVALTGEGVQTILAIEPAQLAFGGVTHGQSAVLSAGIQNLGNQLATVAGLAWFLPDAGNTPLDADGGLDNGGPFHLAYGSALDAGSPWPLFLGAGETFHFSVVYAPRANDAANVPQGALLEPVTTAVDPATTQGALLSGTPLSDCTLRAPASLFVGYAVVPYFDPTAQVTFANEGTDPCTLDAFALAQGSDPGFALPSSDPQSLTIPPNGSGALAVTFAPRLDAGLGPRTGTLLFASVDPATSGLSVALSAVAQDGPYQLGSVWPRYGHDNGRTCLSEVDTSATRPHLRWRTFTSYADAAFFPNVGGFVVGPTLGADGTLYQVGGDGYLRALEPDGGRVLWTVPASPDWTPWAVPDLSVAAPIIAPNGTLIALGDTTFGPFAQPQQELNAIYEGFAPDGGQLWSERTMFPAALSTPLLRPDGTTVFVGSNGIPDYGFSWDAGLAVYRGDGAVAAECTACGGPYSISNQVFAGPEGLTYWLNKQFDDPNTIAGSGGRWTALLPDGGLAFQGSVDATCPGWPFPQDSYVNFLLGGSPFGGSSGGGAAGLFGGVLTPTDVLWSGRPQSELLWDGGYLSAIAAFNRFDGGLDWLFCLEAPYIPSVVALGPDGGVIVRTEYISESYVDDAGDFAINFDAGWGLGFAWIDPPNTVRWAVKLVSCALTCDGGFCPDCWVGDRVSVGAEGTIYAVTSGYPLVALSPKDGSILWTFGSADAGPSGDSSPVIGADGTIYFLDFDGYLNAIR